MSLPISLRLLRLPAPRLLRPSTPSLSAPSTRSYHSTLCRSAPNSPNRPLGQTTSSIALSVPVTTLLSPSPNPSRTLSTSTSGKTPADEIVEELQELYENAKDEFEIATDSTDGGTIYAPSDRESARDALNQLLIVFELYTQNHSPTLTAVRAQVRAEGQEQDGEQEQQQSAAAEEGNEDGEGGQIVETNFDPKAVEQEVREEVKKRVAQRVRELRNAVELLEERALAE